MEEVFPENIILKHITKSVVCKDLYSKAPLKKEYAKLKKKCARSSRLRINKRKVEGYARDKEEEETLMIEESLKSKNAEVRNMPEDLHKRAQLKNEKGFEISREKFEQEFKRFKASSKSSEAQTKIQNLEHLITDTQKMFELALTC